MDVSFSGNLDRDGVMDSMFASFAGSSLVPGRHCMVPFIWDADESSISSRKRSSTFGASRRGMPSGKSDMALENHPFKIYRIYSNTFIHQLVPIAMFDLQKGREWWNWSWPGRWQRVMVLENRCVQGHDGSLATQSDAGCCYPTAILLLCNFYQFLDMFLGVLETHELGNAAKKRGLKHLKEKEV